MVLRLLNSANKSGHLSQENKVLRPSNLEASASALLRADAALTRIFHQFRGEIVDSQTDLALERPLSEAASKPVVAMKRSRKRQERSAKTSEAVIATEI